MEEKDYPVVMQHFLDDIRKGRITKQKINEFKSWMNGKKFKPEWKEEADKLLMQAEKGSNPTAFAEPEILGYPFHNPYTFIPFPKHPPERHAPTPLSIDEVEKDRLSGIVQVEIKTLSPLLTSQAEKENKTEHSILKIGKDVIVPATSVRGSIRNLMSIIYGGTLSYADEELWLCQGRDTQLGRDNLYLAQIVKPGDSTKDGEVIWGKAKLVSYVALFNLLKQEKWINAREDIKKQPLSKLRSPLWIDNPETPTKCSKQKTPEHTWLVKISGEKVDRKKWDKWHEGAFQPSHGKNMVLPTSLWADYQGRNRNGVKPRLQKGDLVWLQSRNNEPINSPHDVESIQWARWGRTGKKLIDKVLSNGFLPDSMNTDGKVDMISDLFGTVFVEKEKEKNSKQVKSFAARIVPANLVFWDSADSVPKKKNDMPPLSSPHPGCIAFYLDNTDPDSISLDDLPRGYKVYRTSKQTGDDAPWLYKNQPVFDRGQQKDFSKVTNSFSADLLPEGKKGTMELAFRALTNKELSLLLLALTCDLRFGGGKPLGLGHCIAEKIRVINEDCCTVCEFEPKRAELPEGYSIDAEIVKRAELYCKTQEPVDMMRYPRFVNENGTQKGGMLWFSRFATVKKHSTVGLQPVTIRGAMQARAGGKKQIRAQFLPKFKQEEPSADWLYGYDAQFVENGKDSEGRSIVVDINGPANITVNPNAPQHENISQNRETRKAIRKQRE